MRVHKLTVIEAAERLGAPGIFGIAAIVAATLYGLLGVLPANIRLEATRVRAANAEARLARNRSGQERAPESPSQQLGKFYDTLPTQADATALIDRIYAAAEQENLSLAKGEYVLVADQAGRLERYQITLPVQGDYLKIRRFLKSVVEAVPYLGLEDISLQRPTITATVLDARIRMTLYLTKPRT